MRLALVLILLCLTNTGCLSGRWVRNKIDSPDNTEIYLEHREAEGKTVPQGYRHPFTIEPRDLARLLAALTYKETGLFAKKEPQPVFSPAELSGLVPTLAGALADAKPDERTSFVSHNWGGGIIFSTRQLTCGTLFADHNGLLNIAFSTINEEHYPTDYAQMGRERRVRDPTVITHSSRPLIPHAWHRLHPRADSEEGVFPLWCLIDTGSALATLSKERLPESEPPSEDQAASAPPTEKKAPEAGLKEKLQLLKNLLEEGLITEEEYKKKKEELLQSI